MYKKFIIIHYDTFFIERFENIKDEQWPIEVKVDQVYSLDVFKHIEPSKEDVYFTNIATSLNKDGSVILGSPSLESQCYASYASIAGHVNYKSAKD